MPIVFVYGTLTDPDRAARVLPAFEFLGPATVEGLHRVDGEYPTLAPGGSVTGRLLSTSHVDALDRYEGVESGLYVRVRVPAADLGIGAPERETVAVYVGDPDRLGVDLTWPGAGSFPAVVARYVERADVRVVAGDPDRAGGE